MKTYLDPNTILNKSIKSSKLDITEKITYLRLKELRNNKKLIPGTKYQIIDYVTTTTQAGTQSANHVFDLILTSLCEDTFSEQVQACLHEKDIYFSNSDLNAWEIKYCIDNDTSRFAWADTENGKGVIYYMKDEFNNEAWYDFKNIQFDCVVRQPHNNVETEFRPEGYDYAYTFTASDGSDLSLTPNSRNNTIKKFTTSGNGLQSLNSTIFICTVAVHNNLLEENSSSNIFWVSSCYYNNIGRAFQNNFISAPSNSQRESIHNNNIGNLFKKNRILSEFSRNYIGNTTTSCDFFSSFSFNEIGNNSWHIDFNYPISYCKFGSYIQYCVFNNTSQFPPVVNEMKWCTFEDGLEGAQYFPCCERVAVEKRSLFNSSNNFHINDITLIDGTKLVEVLTQEHEDYLYVCKIGDSYTVYKQSCLRKIEDKLLTPIYSNPNLDFDSTTNNSNCYGYVGTLNNINVNGNLILIDSISVYVREGYASPNLTTSVWCRLLKFVNNTWETVYQSTESKKIGNFSQKTLFPFKMKAIDDTNKLIKSTDKIAIVYVSSENDPALSSVQLGFKAIMNIGGGLSNPLANDSRGVDNWAPAFVIGYLSMADNLDNVVTTDEYQVINGLKRFDNGLSFIGKTLISSEIDSGELKVFPQGNNTNKGFIIRTNNRNDNIPTIELLATNTQASYNYQFPKRGGTVALTSDLVKPMITPEDSNFNPEPNIYYRLGTIEGLKSINIIDSENSSNIVNEYIFEFTLGSAPNTEVQITLNGESDSIKWEEIPEFKSEYDLTGKYVTYRVSIINGLGVFTKFE